MKEGRDDKRISDVGRCWAGLRWSALLKENRFEQVATVHKQGQEQHHQLRTASWVTQEGQSRPGMTRACLGRSCRENLTAVNRLKLGTK